MSYTRPSLQEIKDRIEKDMESRLTGDVALLRVSLLRVLAMVLAGVSHMMYGFMGFIGDMLFVTNAKNEWLDRHASQWLSNGRIPGGFASGTLKFTGTNGTLIPEDTRVQNDDGIEFAVTSDIAIASGSAYATISAVEIGTSGNLQTGTELQLISPIS